MNHNPINLLFCSLLALTLGLFADSCYTDLNKGNANVKTTLSSADKSYRLVWSDEFNWASVDCSKWNIDNGNSGINNEKEFYKSANTTVSGGNLIITAKHETVEDKPIPQPN